MIKFPFRSLLSPYWCNKIMAKTTIGQRWRVIGRWKAGAPADTISFAMSVPRSTVTLSSCDIENPRDVVDRSRSGKLWKTTIREDPFLCRLPRGQRTDSLSRPRRDWATPNVISYRTVRRRLNTHHYKARWPITRPHLSGTHRQVCMDEITLSKCAFMKWLIYARL